MGYEQITCDIDGSLMIVTLELLAIDKPMSVERGGHACCEGLRRRENQ
ncbi:hypothetical protein MTX26_29290 [Bradyrhizobium sp. ISRA443]|nr:MULTISPECIES: hypothetical protein [unclassified Bradyrhizobium]WGR93726.1 hypothetical protein MTX20_04215 [Bradyrhizobium sp. ISRA435]WGR98310.1 hypothetical protein MTX23_29280 [Bradyrhizobium sp. ISRA436]WGS05198.1 hypothetical protein MTX18_29295 [Bradyrhizobium sp. ISRA437]WGS12084.1 hypothetical protein MTX26_29290 [Bradyrhizobium sp. ISRA443]